MPIPIPKPLPKLPAQPYKLPPRSEWKWCQLHQVARGDGTTTKQINDAPPHSFYICPSYPAIGHTKRIAHRLLRFDLKFVERSIIMDRTLRYLLVPGIVVDHAVSLSYDELVELSLIRIVPV